jgi:uncharacterized protein (DUF488 family)
VSGAAPAPLLTVGHGTLPAERFAALLGGADVSSLVDVRTAPGSRHNPQFGRLELSAWLPEAGIDYRWEKRLGGFRKPAPDSPNDALRHPAFRGYADYIGGEEFGRALDEVLGAAATRRTAVMCSESVWWRCHRRLIADAALLLRGVPVLHLMHDGGLRPHQPTEGATVEDGRLTYPSPARLAGFTPVYRERV